MTKTTYGELLPESQGPGAGTAVGWSPEGDALYTCTRCEGLHRKYESCQYDTGDPWTK